jgi:hypothetical protein
MDDLYLPMLKRRPEHLSQNRLVMQRSAPRGGQGRYSVCWQLFTDDEGAKLCLIAYTSTQGGQWWIVRSVVGVPCRAALTFELCSAQRGGAATQSKPVK